MAYAGSTASAATANPPRLVNSAFWGERSTTVFPGSTVINGQQLWLHNSTDSSTDFITASYFTDAFYLGMKEGDMIMGAVCTGSSVSVYVGVIGPVTTAGAAIASSGGHLSSTR
jgi:hypothetical protein